jgi:tetratricopeptide (TPR) repeat protein
MNDSPVPEGGDRHGAHEVGPARLALIAALAAGIFVAAPPARAEVVAEPDPAAAAAAIAAGDAHYARRGEGADEQRALPFEIDGALAEYRRALSLDPASRDARLRLMRSAFFRGGFCGPMSREARVALFDEAKNVAEDTVATLDAEMKRSKGRVVKGAAGGVATAAEEYLWAAISWGQWAVFHRVSAALSGAPGRIRDLAEAVLSIDPATEQAGAYILLGRLHSEAPRVPFVTGWVSRAKAIAYVRQGLPLAPDNRALVYFTADVLLQHSPASEVEARALLERCATSPPRPDFLAEDLHYARKARERLAGLR